MNFHIDAYMMEEAAMLLPFLTSAFPSTLLGIATYVLSSLALYTLATRRGINKAWLSWVPVLNVWIIGSLSDQYRYVVKGQYKSKRKTLLILNLINAVLALILLIVAMGMTVELTTGAVYGVRGNELLNSVLGSALGAVGLAVYGCVCALWSLFHFAGAYTDCNRCGDLRCESSYMAWIGIWRSSSL